MDFDPTLGPTGLPVRLPGDITTLNAIGGPRPPERIEDSLGFRRGRLARGYSLLLLTEPLAVDDFDFAGTTLRSGGREGLPAATPRLDSQRLHISNKMRLEEGEAEYVRKKQALLARVELKGANRLAKIRPVEKLEDGYSPAIEFPMGGGGLQWTIRKDRPKQFLVALFVTRDLQAITPRFRVSLAPDLPFQQLYDNRAQVARYLETA
jgi:hypothetical protein